MEENDKYLNCVACGGAQYFLLKNSNPYTTLLECTRCGKRFVIVIIEAVPDTGFMEKIRNGEITQ